MKRLTTLALAAASAAAHSQIFSPTPYAQFSDSPFFGGSFSSFALEDFEDGLSNTPGLTMSLGAVIGPANNTDSVDFDDGVLDHHGNGGHSYFSNTGPTGVRATFAADSSGFFPTHVGIVWTDGAGTMRFEAFDASGNSLGVMTGQHADGNFNGGTDEDRFYGGIFSQGVKSITMSNSAGGIEVDHVQFGYATVPEPASLFLLAGATVTVVARRRKKPTE